MNAQILTIRAIATSKIATTAPIMNALLPRKTKEKTPNSAIRMSAVTLALLLINDSDSVGVKMGEGATLPPHQGSAFAARVGGRNKSTDCPARIPRDASATEGADQATASRTAGLVEFDVRQFKGVLLGFLAYHYPTLTLASELAHARCPHWGP